MNIELFDCYCTVGSRMGAVPDEPETVTVLLEHMCHYQIKNALVGHYFSVYGDVDAGNCEALKSVKDNENLWATGCLSPEFDGQSISPGAFLDSFINQKGRLIRLNPKYRNWSLEDWCSKALFDALTERNMPVAISWNETSATAINMLMNAHPELSCILLDLDYRNSRKIIPLLNCHPNFYICIGPRFSGHAGIEMYTQEAGPEQLLFGTRYPECEPGAAISMLMYARINEDARKLIANGNCKRLMGGVQQ